MILESRAPKRTHIESRQLVRAFAIWFFGAILHCPHVLAKQEAEPEPPHENKPRPPSHNLRLQARGAPDIQDEYSAQASYFLLAPRYTLFANGEFVFADNRVSHFESETNLGFIPFHNSSLDWVSINGRLQSDDSPYETFSAGVQLNLDRLPRTERLWKRVALSAFVQYFGLKTDDHLGDHDIYLYYQWKPVGDTVYVRGFSRAFMWNNEALRAIHVADVIVPISGPLDVYFRWADERPPRRSGAFFGFRYLFRLPSD